MKHNFTLLLLLCVSGVVSAADADKDSYRDCVTALITSQVSAMHETMKRHCLVMGLARYEGLIGRGFTQEAARIKVCYSCSQEDFNAAVCRVKTTLLAAKQEEREQLLDFPGVVSQGIEKILKNKTSNF